ncbi:hypothetical protein HYV82_00920 [Candidatus Woesearchaeota archaeon]|nr:hypothetical protein [Candidatus Woesearchaeota archaeon]
MKLNMKLKLRPEYVLLVAVFLASLASRLFVAFGTPNFSYDAYFQLGQVESIRATFLPSFSRLFYSPHPFMPLFHYVLAFFSLFAPLHAVLKVVPNILASSSVFLAYLVSFEMTKDKAAALFSAASVGFVPVFIFSTANTLSPYALAVPLMLALVYFFLRIGENRFVALFVVFLFALVFTHPSALLFVSGLLLYVLVLYVLGAKSSRSELEIMLFSVMASIWIVFLFFKEALLAHGFSVFWQNIPGDVLAEFSGFSVFDAVFRIGLLTFIAGIFVTYRYVFEERRRDVHVVISLSLMVLALLALKLVKLDAGLMFLGVFLAVMSGEAYRSFFEYLGKSKAARMLPAVSVLLASVFILTSVAPSLLYRQSQSGEVPTSGELAAFEWLKNVSSEASVVFSDVNEGHLVVAVSGRRNFVDSNFLLSHDIGQRLSDMEKLYTAKSQITALQIMDSYDLSYIVVTDRALARRNVLSLSYVASCFSVVFEGEDTVIYEPLCRVSS